MEVSPESRVSTLPPYQVENRDRDVPATSATFIRMGGRLPPAAASSAAVQGGMNGRKQAMECLEEKGSG